MNWIKDNISSLILALYVLALAAPQSNAFISISMGLCIAYVLYDIYRVKSLDGFRINKLFIGTVLFFLGTLVLGSVILGDMYSLMEVKNLAEWILVPLLLCFFIAKKDKPFNVVALGIAIALLYMSLLSFNEYFHTKRRVQIFFGWPNTYALVLDVLIPVVVTYAIDCYKTRKNKLYALIIGIIAALGMASLVLTASRAGIVGLMGGLVFTVFAYCVVCRKGFKIFAVIVCLVLAAGVGMYQRNIGRMGADKLQPDVNRFYMWSSAYNMWKDYKLTGVGMHNWTSNYRDKYRKPGATVYSMAHSIYFIFLSTAGTLGILGLLVFIGGNILSLAGALKIQAYQWVIFSALWVSFTIHIMGFVDAGFTMKSACRIFAAVLGLGYGAMLGSNVEKNGEDHV